MSAQCAGAVARNPKPKTTFVKDQHAWLASKYGPKAGALALSRSLTRGRQRAARNAHRTMVLLKWFKEREGGL